MSAAVLLSEVSPEPFSTIDVIPICNEREIE